MLKVMLFKFKRIDQSVPKFKTVGISNVLKLASGVCKVKEELFEAPKLVGIVVMGSFYFQGQFSFSELTLSYFHGSQPTFFAHFELSIDS